MGMLEQIATVLLTSKRHKRYAHEIEQAQIHRVSPPTLGTQIRSTEQDYSHMFNGF